MTGIQQGNIVLHTPSVCVYAYENAGNSFSQGQLIKLARWGRGTYAKEPQEYFTRNVSASDIEGCQREEMGAKRSLLFLGLRETR